MFANDRQSGPDVQRQSCMAVRAYECSQGLACEGLRMKAASWTTQCRSLRDLQVVVRTQQRCQHMQKFTAHEHTQLCVQGPMQSSFVAMRTQPRCPCNIIDAGSHSCPTANQATCPDRAYVSGARKAQKEGGRDSMRADAQQEARTTRTFDLSVRHLFHSLQTSAQRRPPSDLGRGPGLQWAW